MTVLLILLAIFCIVNLEPFLSVPMTFGETILF